MNDRKARYFLDIELLADRDFDETDDYVILRASEWRVVEDWLKLCKKAGVLEDAYEHILNTTIWPLTVRPHTAFDG